MTDYTKLHDADLLHALGADAVKWADAFMQITTQPHVTVDRELMIGWFANAIEHSWDVRHGTIHNGDHAQWLLDKESRQ